jgi:hypothetical protein
MSDETIKSLRQAFMKERRGNQEECPMADKVSEYAFGDLDPDNNQKIQEHLKSCQYCLDLYMDIKMSEAEASPIEEEHLKDLPGFQKLLETKKSRTSSFFQKFRGVMTDFFNQGFSLKPIAAFASVFLVVVIGIYTLQYSSSSGDFDINILLHGRTQIGFRGGQPEFHNFTVDPNGKLNSEDYFKFEISIDDSAFIYVIFQDSSGNIESLQKGFIEGGKTIFLPENEKWFHLDHNIGKERLYIIASADEIPDFSQKVNNFDIEGIDSIEKIFPKATVNAFSFEHK